MGPLPLTYATCSPNIPEISLFLYWAAACGRISQTWRYANAGVNYERSVKVEKDFLKV